MLCNIVIGGRTRMRSTLLVMLTMKRELYHGFLFLRLDVVVFLYSINCFRKNGKEKVHGLRLLYTFRDVLRQQNKLLVLYCRDFNLYIIMKAHRATYQTTPMILK